ncbi:MAG: hypothetical protein KDA83_09620 [Planctomycetales bacterium]|nr:hypothetical protein [Planctomycetales bacterium]
MNRSFVALLVLVITGSIASGSMCQEAANGRRPVPRARRPVFSARQVQSNYFDNVRRDALQGDRPDSLGRVATGGGNTGGATGTPDPGGNGGTSNFAWSTLIAADVIEGQVKQLKLSADTNITTPTKFASGGYSIARTDFSVLAMLFAVINEYDGTVRWQNDAASLRDAFSRAAANAKTGSQQAYNEAKLRKQDLTDIVGGNAFAGTAALEPENDWSVICDRSPLMQRLQVAVDTLKASTASEGSFKGDAELVRAEGSMVALIGEVLTLEGMEDSVEDDYVVFSHEMRQAGVDLVSAVKTESYDQAVSAVSIIGQSCDRCHADWR